MSALNADSGSLILQRDPRQCRRIATRCDKHAANNLAFVKLASIRLWLRAYESTPYALDTTANSSERVRMDATSRAQVRLILEDSAIQAGKEVDTRVKAIHAKHAAKGLLRSGATIKAVGALSKRLQPRSSPVALIGLRRWRRILKPSQ